MTRHLDIRMRSTGRAADAWRMVALVTLAAVVSVGLDTRAAQRDLPPSQHRRNLVGTQFDARVVRVADGDTFEVQIKGETRRLRIRLEGVDAPELNENYGREATVFMRTFIANRVVHVNGRDMDRYGRLVARVTIDGRDASTALVRAGLACHAYVRDAALEREEARARAAQVGFWARSATRPRCVSR